MEVEYIALSQAMQALLPLCSLLEEVGTKVNLSFLAKLVVKLHA